jgi:hypothetical protein
MPRSDSGTKRGKYKNTLDKTGKTTKENYVLKAFWKANKVSDIIQLTPDELDAAIDAWLLAYEARHVPVSLFFSFFIGVHYG